MIYVDSSVILAEVLSQDVCPHPSFWAGELATSRLSEYEVMVRLSAYRASEAHRRHAREVLARVALAELAPAVLERAIEPFPQPVRTLDALHLATCVHLAARVRPLRLATYDRRMSAAAQAIGLEVMEPGVAGE